MLPSASQATSVGRLKLSPASPTPTGAGGAAGAARPAGPRARRERPEAAAPPTPIVSSASGLRPIVMTMRPLGSNLMIMFDPSSTTQMLSWRSTRTVWAKTNP